MRVNFRQGIVSHQPSSFLTVNISGHVDLLAVNKPLTVNLAYRTTNYIHSEDNSVFNAWKGPFVALTKYWLYLNFNPLTFVRTFNKTTVEPVVQSVAPGSGNAIIKSVVAGNPHIGFFVVPEHYVLPVGRSFVVTNSVANNGTYTVASTTFNGVTGDTTVYVDEIIPDSTPSGEIALDVDSSGTPLLIDGRFWYNTATNIQFVRTGNVWTEVLCIFISELFNGTFLSISADAPLFTGTQIGNISSVLSGRILVDESMKPLSKDNGEFLTTEDQFFTNQSRTDGVRIESNVSKAQNAASTLAAFTAVSYVGEGKITAAKYDDTGNTVIGLLTEGIGNGEVGSVVLQGVVTNPNWNWLVSNTVGQTLWIDNGLFVAIDPHIADPITYPVGKVPVARILSNTSIIFEQGLGGKGDKGSTGSVTNIPPATTSTIGGVTLLTPSSNPSQAFVVSDTDPRLTDARSPLPHTHIATDIIYTPGFGITAGNVQNMGEQLAISKLGVAGGTMQGTLILSSDPTTPFSAATKQYVDNLVSGLVWLDPIDKTNLISDNVAIPPTTPILGDAYIVPSGAVGAWSGIPAGNITTWNGTTWINDGPLTGVNNTPRFGISFTNSTVPSGSFLGHKDNIAEYDQTGTLIGFVVPSSSNAVYVRNILSVHAFNQYAFNGTSWVEFGGGQQASKLNDLVDVDTVTTPPTDGQALAWNAVNSLWEPSTISSGVSSGVTNPLTADLNTNGYNLITIANAPGVASKHIGIHTGNSDTLAGGQITIKAGDTTSGTAIGRGSDILLAAGYNQYGGNIILQAGESKSGVINTQTPASTITIMGGQATYSPRGFISANINPLPLDPVHHIFSMYTTMVPLGPFPNSFSPGIEIRTGDNTAGDSGFGNQVAGDIVIKGGSSRTGGNIILTAGYQSGLGYTSVQIQGAENPAYGGYTQPILEIYAQNNNYAIKLQAPYGLTQNPSFTFPSTEGMNSNVLQTDGYGLTSWTPITPPPLTINTQTGLVYTITLADTNNLVSMTNAAANTVTIPLDASLLFPIGSQLLIEQGGIGQTTIVGETIAVIIQSSGGFLKLSTQHTTIAAIKKAVNTWLLVGDLV